MKTIRGIYYDIRESEYVYQSHGLQFYFSSEFYLKKFKNNIEQYIKEENNKLRNRYKIFISLDIYFMIAYYKKIEKRGFRIYDMINKRDITENVGLIEQIICY